MENRALFEKIDQNKAAIEAYRPLTPDEVKEQDDYFRIVLT